MTTDIIEVHFTYSWNGFALRFADGRVETHTADSIINEFGQKAYDHIWKTAYHNGMTGMWYKMEGK